MQTSMPPHPLTHHLSHPLTHGSPRSAASSKAAGATADEWRERAAKVRSAKLTLEQAEAVQEAVYTAWNAARQAGREDAEAADRRGETWWRDLWKAEGMCEAWQGPLPPYMSTVCTCCSDTVLMYMNQRMSS